MAPSTPPASLLSRQNPDSFNKSYNDAVSAQKALSTAAIVGIVIAVVVGLAVLAIIVFVVLRIRKREKRREREQRKMVERANGLGGKYASIGDREVSVDNLHGPRVGELEHEGNQVAGAPYELSSVVRPVELGR
jgi:flagellar biosynthesis/type III secretory pathway M-ring protein FliF/YscJ